MSQSIHYKPVMNNGIHIGGCALKNILQEKYGYPARLTAIDVSYLQGLHDAGIANAECLIEAIEKYSVIEIYLES